MSAFTGLCLRRLLVSLCLAHLNPFGRLVCSSGSSQLPCYLGIGTSQLVEPFVSVSTLAPSCHCHVHDTSCQLGLQVIQLIRIDHSTKSAVSKLFFLLKPLSTSDHVLVMAFFLWSALSFLTLPILPLKYGTSRCWKPRISKKCYNLSIPNAPVKMSATCRSVQTYRTSTSPLRTRSPYKVVVYFYVLRASMEHGVLGLVHAIDVVPID